MLSLTELRLALKLGPWLAILLLVGVVCAQSSRIHKWHEHAIALSTALDKIDADARKLSKDGAAISKDIRSRTDEENSRVADDTGALRMRGPGKALCRPAPAASGGPQQDAPQPDAPVGQVPGGEGQQLIGMPFPGAANGAGEHDQLLAEVKGWREWYRRLSDAWPETKPTKP